ncbi:MAG: hypothetical protein CMA11_05310 [Euryarchaeota archaeon]|nr:hypothetical protein [Euryarchaeota archaeon]
MSSPKIALLLVALFILGGIQIPEFDDESIELQESLFEGFSVSNDVWNETPFQAVAVPGGFNLSSAIDYSDVAVLINNQSEASRTIGWAFVSARNISAERIFVFDNSSNPTAETINRNQFDTYFLEPFRTMLSTYNGSDINYLVTTKGIPLRINGGNDKASFDQEMSLAGGSFDSDIGSDWWSNHGYGPLAGKQMKEFTRDEYGFFLVTRLTGYTVDTALELIEKANNSYASRGTHVLDLATNRNGSGYKFWNDDLYVANSTLNGSMNLPVYFDEETEFVTNFSNVIGYASWGSNDGNWNKNYLANGGFDNLDSSWSSGSKYWNISGPTVSSGDEFNWSYQTDTKQGGNGAFEASISTDCEQESGHLLPGIFSEYFDNEGLSFNSATMPDLIDREPDHIRIENSLAYSSSGNPYPGLDDRFKHNWGARFSGLIDVPEDGNWTFYLNTDDGSELWINGVSAIQNYGMHGMREYSATLNLTAGYHDFRIEFFQGGGPHGLKFSWQGPNVSKATIPASAFLVSGNYVPQSENLIHRWDFEESTGNQSDDSVANSSNFTLYGMNSSNWKSCLDGNCLWYDGVNDYAKVNVDDWLGNFSISQWVWANSTNQSTYASTFAIDDNAGSNQSFQHMISGGEWKLHNNQTKTFGDVIAQKWSHLVTVFDSGETRQYMDGVLVNSNSYPNGSVNNFDLYKLGVNRAGNSYFEGMIDNVMIWDTALNNSSVTVLNRNIVNNCSAYSGNGQGIAYLETTHDIPVNFTNHAWAIYTYGKRSGDVFGEYNIQVTSYDSNGTLLLDNDSSNQDFNSAWNSITMRFRPHSDASSLKIRISLDIVPSSTDGSLFIDSTVLRVIRPHMDWVNGSIVETAVSTGARSFNWGTSYGQSLVADILEDGASGIKGYVYEPYLTAVSSPSVLLSSYSSGFNLAESYAAANTMTSWMGVVVGDPKMSPYANIVHDVEIIDVRVQENVSINQTFDIEIAIQNIGQGEAVGQLKVMDKLGSIILANQSLVIPNGDMNGSRQILTLQMNSSREGWNNLVIRWDATSILNPEREIDNNLFDLTLWVNTAPIIEDIFCDSSQYSRDDRFVCSLEATDDSLVYSSSLAWRISYGNNSSTEWVWQSAASQDGFLWWTTIDLPADIPLGMLDLAVNVTDESNLSTFELSLSIAEIRDAPAFWFGTHVSGVDDSGWGGASVLTSFPFAGIKRGHILILKACVLDPDHDRLTQQPQFLSSRGQIDGLTYQPGSSDEHHCYIASFTLSTSSSLDSLHIELRTSEGDFLTRRTFQISDQEPVVNLSLVDENNLLIENILGGGNEYLRIEVTDYDDSVDGAYGDLSLKWPGQPSYSWPIEFENGIAFHPLFSSETISNGNLVIDVEVTGANGANNSTHLETPIVLSPPEILKIDLCQDGTEIEELMFGQTADAVVRVRSSRPLDIVQASLEQDNWIVYAPSQGEVVCGNELAEQTDELHFRIQLDSSFIPGNGSLGVRVVDIDEIISISHLHFEFLHSPPEIEVSHQTNLSHETLFEILIEMDDADGIDADCAVDYLQNNTTIYSKENSAVTDLDGTGIWSTSWLLPNDLTGNMTISISCEDWSGNVVEYTAIVIIDIPDDCIEDCGDLEQETDEKSEAVSTPLVIVGLLVIFVVISLLVRARTRGDEEIPETWHNEEIAPERDERIPDGWSLEEFLDWLDGPVPDEWEEEQWETYRSSLEDLR